MTINNFAERNCLLDLKYKIVTWAFFISVLLDNNVLNSQASRLFSINNNFYQKWKRERKKKYVLWYRNR